MNKRIKKTLAIHSCYKTVFRSPEGEKVLDDLLKYCHILNTTFSTDPYESALQEGERNVALYILKKINANVEQMKKFAERQEKEQDEYDY